MANQTERGPARLVCVNGHEYVVNSAPLVRTYVAEQDEPKWKIDFTDLRCRACGGEFDRSLSEPL